MSETHMLRTPRKGEKYNAKHCVLSTTDALLSYKRGMMKGITGKEALGWQEGLQDVIDEWSATKNHLTERKIDNAVLELVKAVVNYFPVHEDDLRGF